MFRTATARRAMGVLVSSVTAGMVLIGAGSASADGLPVSSTEDLNAPSITSLTVDPLSVDVTDNLSKTVTGTLHVTDDLSGFTSGSVAYVNAATNQYINFYFDANNKTAGTALDGTYTNPVQVTPQTANGSYAFSYAYVQDTVGNYHYYDSAGSFAPASLTVISNADAVPPTITSVALDTNPLDVSGGMQASGVTVQATDDRSGVAYVSGAFQSPSGRQAASFYAMPTTQAGVLAGTTQVARYSEPGEWALSYICVRDNSNNSTCYDGWSTPSVTDMFSLTLSVISAPADEQAPAVSAYRLSPASGIDVTDEGKTVTTDIDVSDSLSGVRYAYIRFSSPRTVGASPEVIDRYGTAFAPSIDNWGIVNGQWVLTSQDDSKRMLSGTLSASTFFPRYDRSGAWTVAEVCVIDNVNWQTCYNPWTQPPLSELGPTELPVKWNRTPNVAVSGIADATYYRDAEPTPTCTVSDLEDGVISDVQPVITRTGDSVSVSCSFTDSGAVTGSATKSYVVVDRPAPVNTTPTVAVTGVDEATYVKGSQPTAGCDAADAEDGLLTVAPIVQGPDVTTGLGFVTVTCTATDHDGASATDVKQYEVVAPPNTAPVVSVAGVTATSYELGSVPAASCVVNDAEDTGASTVATLGPITGPLASLGLGTVQVSCSYTDAGGLTDSDDLTYTIVDTVAPALTLANVTVRATSNAGAPASYTTTATDAVDPAPAVSCDQVSGALFDIGTTTVDCTATDAAGNASTGTFTVTVAPTCTASTLQNPVNTNGSSVFKLGSTVPLKIILSNCYGTTPAEVAPQVSLRRLDTSPDGVVNEVLASGAANEGTTMRYDGTQHMYNLSTKRSQFCATGTAFCLSGDLTAGTYEVTISAPQLATPVKNRFNLRK